MDKTRTIGQKWLANELDLHFLALKKCTKFQSNRSILSKVIVLTNEKSTQTDRNIRKTHFFGFRGSQNVDIWQKRGGHILHKSITFSDENVKNGLTLSPWPPVSSTTWENQTSTDFIKFWFPPELRAHLGLSF